MPCSGFHIVPSGPPEFSELTTSYVLCGDRLNIMIDAGVSNSVADFSFLDKLELVILTHVHIDHIGLLPEILQTYKPKILVKSGFKKYLTTDDGVRRLNESSEKILGDLYYLYGEFRKIDPDKVLEIDGGEKIDLGGQVIELINTPGHAKHHISVRFGDFLFTGDSAGGYFNGVVFPTTPPPNDYEKYVDSLIRQINLKPKYVGLAHGGLVSPKVMEDHLKQILSDHIEVGKIDIGGIAGDIIKKHIQINLEGLRESKTLFERKKLEKV